MITLGHYIAVSGLLFCIGLLGVLVRRNVLIIYMCLELMLTAAMIAFVAFSRFSGNLDGQVMVFFIITVAAAEVAVGLGIIVAWFRLKRSTGVDEMKYLRF
jgi:NADH-quinone oxidoreductase subunit K